jgi:hypothetical protein
MTKNEDYALHKALPPPYIESESHRTHRNRRLSIPAQVVRSIDEFVRTVTDDWYDEHRVE